MTVMLRCAGALLCASVAHAGLTLRGLRIWSLADAYNLTAATVSPAFVVSGTDATDAWAAARGYKLRPEHGLFAPLSCNGHVLDANGAVPDGNVSVAAGSVALKAFLDPSKPPKTRALRSFYSERNQAGHVMKDWLVAASDAGISRAQKAEYGYAEQQVEGYCYAEKPMNVPALELIQYQWDRRTVSSADTGQSTLLLAKLHPPTVGTVDLNLGVNMLPNATELLGERGNKYIKLWRECWVPLFSGGGTRAPAAGGACRLGGFAQRPHTLSVGFREFLENRPTADTKTADALLGVTAVPDAVSAGGTVLLVQMHQKIGGTPAPTPSGVCTQGMRRRLDAPFGAPLGAAPLGGAPGQQRPRSQERRSVRGADRRAVEHADVWNNEGAYDDGGDEFDGSEGRALNTGSGNAGSGAASTAAPTPAPTFPASAVKVVVLTTLSGMSASDFGPGAQKAYRLALAGSAGVDVANVTLSDFSRRLAQRGAAQRRLASSVAFNAAIKVADTAATAAMETKVAAIAGATLATSFIAQLQLVQAAGDFAELAALNVGALVISVALATPTIFAPDITQTGHICAPGNLCSPLSPTNCPKHCRCEQPSDEQACESMTDAECTSETRDSTLRCNFIPCEQMPEHTCAKAGCAWSDQTLQCSSSYSALTSPPTGRAGRCTRCNWRAGMDACVRMTGCTWVADTEIPGPKHATMADRVCALPPPLEAPCPRADDGTTPVQGVTGAAWDKRRLAWGGAKQPAGPYCATAAGKQRCFAESSMAASRAGPKGWFNASVSTFLQTDPAANPQGAAIVACASDKLECERSGKCTCCGALARHVVPAKAYSGIQGSVKYVFGVGADHVSKSVFFAAAATQKPATAQISGLPWLPNFSSQAANLVFLHLATEHGPRVACVMRGANKNEEESLLPRLLGCCSGSNTCRPTSRSSPRADCGTGQGAAHPIVDVTPTEYEVRCFPPAYVTLPASDASLNASSAEYDSHAFSSSPGARDFVFDSAPAAGMPEPFFFALTPGLTVALALVNGDAAGARLRLVTAPAVNRTAVAAPVVDKVPTQSWPCLGMCKSYYQEVKVTLRTLEPGSYIRFKKVTDRTDKAVPSCDVGVGVCPSAAEQLQGSNTQGEACEYTMNTMECRADGRTVADVLLTKNGAVNAVSCKNNTVAVFRSELMQTKTFHLVDK